MSDMPPIPGDVVKTTLYKVTQKLPNNAFMCKVFQPEGMGTALADLLAQIPANGSKQVEISTLQLNTKAVNLEDFFKTGGFLFSTTDIK